MRTKMPTRFTAIALLAVLVVPSQLGGQQEQAASPATPTEEGFVLTSTTFANGARLPLSMIFSPIGGAADGAMGGDQSPQMSWTAPKPGTQSFVVMLYDVTAALRIGECTTFLPMRQGFRRTQVLPEAHMVPRSRTTLPLPRNSTDRVHPRTASLSLTNMFLRSTLSMNRSRWQDRRISHHSAKRYSAHCWRPREADTFYKAQVLLASIRPVSSSN
jgi:hypothetical protein